MKYLSNISRTKVLNIVGSILIIGGLIFAIPALYYRWTNAGSAAASPVTAAQVWGEANSNSGSHSNEKLVTGFPVSISIPGPRAAANIGVGIIPGYYNAKTNGWTLTETDAQFAVISAQPNNISGNTFIYGHYRPNVFAYLHLITPGTIATITTNNGYKFNYKFINTYAVTPTDTAVLSNSQNPILTLQTCSGSFFQNRQMYIFSYVNYAKVQ